MLNLSKAFTEGITNLQNAWKTTIEKQMENDKIKSIGCDSLVDPITGGSKVIGMF
jgi:hypothetical protein